MPINKRALVTASIIGLSAILALPRVAESPKRNFEPNRQEKIEPHILRLAETGIDNSFQINGKTATILYYKLGEETHTQYWVDGRLYAEHICKGQKSNVEYWQRYGEDELLKDESPENVPCTSIDSMLTAP